MPFLARLYIAIRKQNKQKTQIKQKQATKQTNKQTTQKAAWILCFEFLDKR